MNTVLITGSNRGIGLELVQRYLARGDAVIACCRDPAGAKALQSLTAEAPTLSIEALSVADADSVRDLKRRLGERPINILINNAGMGGPYLDKEPADDLDIEAWLETFRVNSIAPLHLLRQLRSNLAAAGGAKAVSISSQMGAISFEFAHTMYAYSASKAALNKIMRMIAEDMKADRIAVHVMHPGWVRTDMGGSGADISAQESADGIVTVIDELGLEDAGSFRKWNGEVHPW